MTLLRSESNVDVHCQQNRIPRGEAVPLETVWQLSKIWYWDRMDPTFRGRTAEDARAIFRTVGLTSEFWQG